jgi:crotonobetainyl-CoA:carnitine CoA-transferase CaiB-like acyl-CoA transferase
VIAVSDKQWKTIFTAMGVPELAIDPRFATLSGRSDNVDALYGTLTEGMRTRTTAEWLAILRPADIPCGPAGTLLDLFDDAYLQETNFFESWTHPVEGPVVTTAIPGRFSETPPSVHRLWPTLGEHNREILREVGCSEAEIDDITS